MRKHLRGGRPSARRPARWIYVRAVVSGVGRLPSLRLARGQDGDDLELHEVVPARDPLAEERRVFALHQLKAPAEALLDPALDVAQPCGRHPPALAEAAVDLLRRLAAPEALDDHEQHRARPSDRPRLTAQPTNKDADSLDPARQPRREREPRLRVPDDEAQGV